MARSGASAGTRTRVQALATPGDNHYTTLAGTLRILQGFKRLSAVIDGCVLGAEIAASLHAKAVAATAFTTAPHHRDDRQRSEEHHHAKPSKNKRAQTTGYDGRFIGFDERDGNGCRVEFPVGIKRSQRNFVGAQRGSISNGQDHGVDAVSSHFVPAVHAVIVHEGPRLTANGREHTKVDLNPFNTVRVGDLDGVGCRILRVLLDGGRRRDELGSVVENVHLDR